MTEQDERLEIGALGAAAILRPAGARAAPGDLTFDLVGRPRGFVTFAHLHARQVERLEVIAGRMRVDLAGRSHRLSPGDRLEVPAGVSHRQRALAGAVPHVRVTVSPAGRTEDFLRRLAELSSAGRFTRAGFPRPVAAAELVRDFGDTGRATIPPAAVQRLVAGAILAEPPLGRRLRAVARHLWRAYEFVDEWEVSGAPPEAVYAVLVDGRSYPRWWRPVRIAVESDGPPAVGHVARQHFKGRLPYHLHTRSTLVRLEPGALIEAEVDGDLRGRGIWTLTPTPAGTRVRFDWSVHADRVALRVLTPALRPILRANHGWAIARAIDGLGPYVLAMQTGSASAGMARRARSTGRVTLRAAVTSSGPPGRGRSVGDPSRLGAERPAARGGRGGADAARPRPRAAGADGAVVAGCDVDAQAPAEELLEPEERCERARIDRRDRREVKDDGVLVGRALRPYPCQELACDCVVDRPEQPQAPDPFQAAGGDLDRVVHSMV
jgi:mannose-6-phosphate isomerase-like protein (cupin superfamily)/uncharacterized protein YndB with AHSA1/START domain